MIKSNTGNTLLQTFRIMFTADTMICIVLTVLLNHPMYSIAILLYSVFLNITIIYVFTFLNKVKVIEHSY